MQAGALPRPEGLLLWSFYVQPDAGQQYGGPGQPQPWRTSRERMHREAAALGKTGGTALGRGPL